MPTEPALEKKKKPVVKDPIPTRKDGEKDRKKKRSVIAVRSPYESEGFVKIEKMPNINTSVLEDAIRYAEVALDVINERAGFETYPLSIAGSYGLYILSKAMPPEKIETDDVKLSGMLGGFSFVKQVLLKLEASIGIPHREFVESVEYFNKKYGRMFPKYAVARLTGLAAEHDSETGKGNYTKRIGRMIEIIKEVCPIEEPLPSDDEVEEGSDSDGDDKPSTADAAREVTAEEIRKSRSRSRSRSRSKGKEPADSDKKKKKKVSKARETEKKVSKKKEEAAPLEEKKVSMKKEEAVPLEEKKVSKKKEEAVPLEVSKKKEAAPLEEKKVSKKKEEAPSLQKKKKKETTSVPEPTAVPVTVPKEKEKEEAPKKEDVVVDFDSDDEVESEEKQEEKK